MIEFCFRSSTLMGSMCQLMQISAYIMQKDLAVRKIMEAMHTVYAEKRDSVSTHEYFERKARIVCEHFISLNCLINLVLKVLLKCAIRLSTSSRWCAFPFVRKFLVHLCTVYASPQKLARPLMCVYRMCLHACVCLLFVWHLTPAGALWIIPFYLVLMDFVNIYW